MAKIEITVNGVAYPCRQTMGAMLRFKRETGKEVTDIKGDISDLCVYLWCCVASASKADKLDFNMSLMDFADSISPDDLTAWAAVLNAEAEAESEAEADDGEKKSQ